MFFYIYSRLRICGTTGRYKGGRERSESHLFKVPRLAKHFCLLGTANICLVHRSNEEVSYEQSHFNGTFNT